MVLGSLFVDSIWVVRVGAVIALLMAVAAVSVAWMELKRERAEHREEIKRQVAIRVEKASTGKSAKKAWNATSNSAQAAWSRERPTPRPTQ